MIGHSKERRRFTSRRQFLRSTAAGAMASTAAGSLFLGSSATAAPASEDDGGDIDAHVHVWTADVKTYPLAAGFTRADMKPAAFTPETLLAHCRPNGVRRIVLIQMSFYQFDNRFMLDAIQQYPGIFRGVAILDDSLPGVCESMRRLAKQGVSGFRLYADRKAAESWLDSPSMSAMWKCAADSDQAMCLLADSDALPAIHKLCRRRPDTRVVIDHFARIGLDGAIRADALDNLCRLAQHPNVFVKTSAFYALGKKKPPYTDLGEMIRKLRDSFGSERMMWGSDAPYQVDVGHSYAASLALIRSELPFLSLEDKSWLLRKTAAQVFKFR